MLYYTLRPFVRLLLKFCTKHISIKGLENIPSKGAVLLAANHPNSFFDAIVICCHIDRQVWTLARGDVFKKTWVKRILSSLFLLPVYRLSDGRTNVSDNDDTFNRCVDLFKKEQIILIFSEGLCTNQTEILPLKKGTARMVQQSFKSGVEVSVVPIGVSYENYHNFGKNINLNVGKGFGKALFEKSANDADFLTEFNDILFEKLTNLADWTFKNPSFAQNPLFYIGSIINFPANFLATFISKKFTKGTVFFDSVSIGLMVIIYPIYWIFLAYFLYFMTKNY